MASLKPELNQYSRACICPDISSYSPWIRFSRMINNPLMMGISMGSCAVDTLWLGEAVKWGDFAPFKTVTEADILPEGKLWVHVTNSPLIVSYILIQEDIRGFTGWRLYLSSSLLALPCKCKGNMEFNQESPLTNGCVQLMLQWTSMSVQAFLIYEFKGILEKI